MTDFQDIISSLNVMLANQDTADQRERRNTLTLATISEMVSEILLELRKPIPQTSPMADALRALIALVEQQSQALARIEAALSDIKDMTHGL